MNYNLKRILMIKNFLKHKYIQDLIGWLISFYIKICFHTSLWYVKNDQSIKTNLIKKKSIIVCFWHGRMLMTPFCWNYETKFKMLISEHRDGRIISNAVAHLGIETISGSSNKKKISSAKRIIEELHRFNVVGITPDGPRGPKEKVKEGIISLQKKTNSIIIPLSYSARFKIKLKSWDDFLFIFPFNKFVAVWGNPIKYDPNKDLKHNLQLVDDELNRITKLSDNLSK